MFTSQKIRMIGLSCGEYGMILDAAISTQYKQTDGHLSMSTMCVGMAGVHKNSTTAKFKPDVQKM